MATRFTVNQPRFVDETIGGEALVMDWGLARRIGVLEGDVESGSRAVGEESISFDGETMFE